MEDDVTAEVGLYLRRAQAEDRALVVLSMGLPYWIIPADGLYALVVRQEDAAAVKRELASYEHEARTTRRRPSPPKPLFRPTAFPIFLYAWALGLCFLIQERAPAGWVDAGAAESSRIMAGEWWRTITALTLHADLGHLLANTVVGIIFGLALIPWIGFGWAALGFIVSGALGNTLNALFHYHTLHSSIGASTAVFGSLGLLVGWQTWALLHEHRTAHPLRHRELFIPLGAGFALLAYLGTGGEESRVDIMAHLFGLLAGVVLGILAGWGKLPQRTPPSFQKYLALLAFLLPCLAWAAAVYASPLTSRPQKVIVPDASPLQWR